MKKDTFDYMAAAVALVLWLFIVVVLTSCANQHEPTCRRCDVYDLRRTAPDTVVFQQYTITVCLVDGDYIKYSEMNTYENSPGMWHKTHCIETEAMRPK